MQKVKGEVVIHSWVSIDLSWDHLSSFRNTSAAAYELVLRHEEISTIYAKFNQLVNRCVDVRTVVRWCYWRNLNSLGFSLYSFHFVTNSEIFLPWFKGFENVASSLFHYFLSVLNFSLLKSLLLIIEIPTNRLFQITYEVQKLCNFVKVIKLSSPNDYDKTNAKSKGEDNKYKEEPLATIFICRSFPATTSLDRIGHVFITLKNFWSFIENTFFFFKITRIQTLYTMTSSVWRSDFLMSWIEGELLHSEGRVYVYPQERIDY